MKPKKLDQSVVNLLVPRLSDELHAFYQYRAISNWCSNVGYFKASKYFSKESEDELSHAKGIEDFLTQWNITPALKDVKTPQTEFKSLVEVIELAYSTEFHLYEMYEESSVRIFEMGDLCVFDFLQKYRTIQSNSVAEYSDMLNVLEGVESTKFNLLLLEETLFED